MSETHERIKITLPLSADERAKISAALAARAAAWVEYVKAYGAARAEYVKACGAARAEYAKARAAAWAECDKACGVAWSEYDKACGAAWSECGSALASWVWASFGEQREDEASRVLEALRDGVDMVELREIVRREVWCGAWDEALASANERFDIS